LKVRRNGLSRKTVASLVIVLAVACLFASYRTRVAVSSSEFPPIGGDVKNIIQIVQKWDDPTLFARDFAFSDNGYRLYLPAYIHLVRFVDRIFGANNYERSIQFLMFPICFLFVVSSTWLFWRITKRLSLSLVMAIVSTLSFEVIYGSLAYSVGLYVTPRFLHLAIAPVLFGLLLLKGRDRLYGPILFFLTGVSANIHFGSGTALVFAFFLGWIIYGYANRSPGPGLRHWTICACAGLLGAVPYVWSFLSSQTPDAVINVPAQVYNAMLRSRFPFYPMDIFGSGQLQWPSWAVTSVTVFFYLYPFIAIAALIASRSGLKRLGYFGLYLSNLAFMLLAAANNAAWMLLAASAPMIVLVIKDLWRKESPDEIKQMLVYLIPGFAFTGVIFSLWVVDAATHFGLYMPSFYYDFGVAVKYVPFMFNVYTALAAKEAMDAWGHRRRSGESVSALSVIHSPVFIALIAISVIFRFVGTQYNGYDDYRRNLPKVVRSEPLFVPTSLEKDYRQATAWVKSNTSKDALFLVLVNRPGHDFMFRYKARRSMWVCRKDGGFSFYKGRGSLVNWYDEFRQRQNALGSRSVQDVERYAMSRRIDYAFLDREGYSWLEKESPGGIKLHFRNGNYSIVSFAREDT
jgi:hypothetical protein